MSNRVLLARKTVIYSGLEQAACYVLSFVSRKVFLVTAGAEYLGLNSTLIQLIGMLSVAELGVQSVVIYKLYEPLAKDDKNMVCQIISAIRTFYRMVATLIIMFAIICIPFMDRLVTDVSIPWNQVYIAWFIIAASSSLSYVLNYNGAILYADQKQYLYQRIHLILTIVIYALQIGLLFATKNYFIYLALYVFNSVFGNVVLLLLRKKIYPWVRFAKVSFSTTKSVVSSSMDAFAGRVCAYVFNSTDSVIVSAFIGTTLVGYVGNYTSVTFALMSVVSSISGSIQAIIGNMLVSDKSTPLMSFLLRYTYVLNFISSILYIPAIMLLDDFVVLMYGSKYLLGDGVVYLLGAYMYLTMLQTPAASMLDADGQFRASRNMYFIASIINITLSVIGARVLGICGVLGATVVGSVYLLIYRVYYCCKCVIKCAAFEIAKYSLYILKLAFVFAASYIFVLCFSYKFFNDVTIITFVIKGIVSVFTVFFLQVVVFGRSEEFKYAINFLRR